MSDHVQEQKVPAAWLVKWKDADEQEQRVFDTEHRKDDWLERLSGDELVSDLEVTPLHAAPVQVDGVREMTDSEREQAYPPYKLLGWLILWVGCGAVIYLAGVALFILYIGIRAMILGWV